MFSSADLLSKFSTLVLDSVTMSHLCLISSHFPLDFTALHLCKACPTEVSIRPLKVQYIYHHKPYSLHSYKML